MRYTILALAASLSACSMFSPAPTRAPPPPPPPAPAAENLSTSEITTRDVQDRLHDQGLYNGPSDGVWGPRTQSAVRAYQAHNNLAVTGQLDEATLHALDASTPVPPVAPVHNP
jgi:peptidoglycan hydrolase-like protein with peptidoglycan-binding domain